MCASFGGVNSTLTGVRCKSSSLSHPAEGNIIRGIGADGYIPCSCRSAKITLPRKTDINTPPSKSWTAGRGPGTGDSRPYRSTPTPRLACISDRAESAEYRKGRSAFTPFGTPDPWSLARRGHDTFSGGRARTKRQTITGGALCFPSINPDF